MISSLLPTLHFDISECQFKKDNLLVKDKRLLKLLNKTIIKVFNGDKELECLEIFNRQQANPIFHPFLWQ